MLQKFEALEDGYSGYSFDVIIDQEEKKHVKKGSKCLNLEGFRTFKGFLRPVNKMNVNA